VRVGAWARRGRPARARGWSPPRRTSFRGTPYLEEWGALRVDPRLGATFRSNEYQDESPTSRNAAPTRPARRVIQPKPLNFPGSRSGDLGHPLRRNGIQCSDWRLQGATSSSSRSRNSYLHRRQLRPQGDVAINAGRSVDDSLPGNDQPNHRNRY
jgi:hypothetical protein